MEAIVTKAWLANKIAANPSEVIGRALVAIFNNQTADEQSGNETTHNNNIGFTQADARVGCIGAKYFLKHGKMEEWQIKFWMKANRKGQPKIVKYAGQLNEIAKRNQKLNASNTNVCR